MNKVCLKEFSELITKGTTPSSVGCEFVEEGINFIKSESISDSKYLNSSKYEHIDILTDAKLKRSRLKEGDLLFSIAGAYLGKVAIVQSKDLPANTNQAVGIVRLNRNKIDVDYLYYYFSQKHINEYINKLSSQSSQPNLNLDLLGKLEFDYKDLITQKKISRVLSLIDSKIEINNKINSDLESMAKTLYDYWFVQFDFPNESGKPYKYSGGKMAWNEELKREIPEGWEVDIIDSVLSSLTKGITTEYVEKSNLINLNQKANKGFVLDRQYFKYLDENIPIPEEKFAREKDILINSLGQGTLGRIHFFCEKVKNIVVDQHLFILRTNSKKITATYLYFLLTSKAYQIQIDRQITGSTGMQMLNASNLKDIKILIPNLRSIQQFEQTIYPFFEKIKLNELQNQRLSEMRDWLLPMMMNGQVKVN